MDPNRWQKINALFEACSELSPAKRDAFLSNACGDDTELIDEVKKLCHSFESGESFLESPAVGEVQSMFEEHKTAISHQTTGDVKGGDFVSGTVLASRYRIIGLVGKGGMGEVYKAEDIKLSQVVALKFLPDKLENDPAALERFHGEVRNARQVSHRNVCRVFDIGEVDGRHFLSMEYVDGDDISSLLKRVGRLPSERAVEIARQLCVGLAAIHRAGILHRDFKPANIIIDSKGIARITDFGISGIEEHVADENMRVGTPAYMSPEQLTGNGVSTRSDIYALGLVLYEIFTGRQAFSAESITDLIKLHKSGTPTNPSEHVKGIDPLVESVIFQCLEKDPNNRPPSAMHVAMALPGGNPLQVALDAGETPSPEMVAAAPKKGALRPIAAIACLGAVVASLAFIILFSSKIKHQEWLPLERSPEVLAARSEAMLANLGYAAAVVDSDYGFADYTRDYYRYAERDPSPDRWEKMRTGQPAIIFFWHRTSPRYLEPSNYLLETVSIDDPPIDIAGMTLIMLDGRGRLMQFQAVPPQVKDKTADPGKVDWSMLFTEAGLDIRKYRPTQSGWTPPSFADTTLSWEGPHVDHPEIPVRIEAAAYQGKPVYFQVVAPWDTPFRQEELPATPARRAAGVLLILILASVVIGGVFLARHNLRAGRSDNKGTFKVTIFVFLASLSGSLLMADHMPDLGKEVGLLFKITGSSLFIAAVVGLIYVALEPYARRRWPNLIISWNRLLAGDFRDPMVGRDILVGGILGLGHTIAIYLMRLIPNGLGITVPPNDGANLSYLQGYNHLLGNTLSAPVNGIFLAFFTLLFLVFLVTILRKQWLAMTVFWAAQFSVLGLAFASSGGHWVLWLGPAMIAGVMVVCIARFGLLAMVSFQFFFELSFHNPVSANFSNWYFGNTAFAVVVLLGIAFYGFRISLAGQKLFESKFLTDPDH